jgi:hypothetical protein
MFNFSSQEFFSRISGTKTRQRQVREAFNTTES